MLFYSGVKLVNAQVWVKCPNTFGSSVDTVVRPVLRILLNVRVAVVQPVVFPLHSSGVPDSISLLVLQSFCACSLRVGFSWVLGFTPTPPIPWQ